MTLIKWAGGKTWLLPRLTELFKPYDHVIDLFSGGQSVTLEALKEGKKVTSNDLNTALVCFHYCVKNGINPTHLFTELGHNSMDGDRYYFYRDNFNNLLTDNIVIDYITQSINSNVLAILQMIPLSKLFYLLNKTGFNGLYRVNKKGEFNTPYGKRVPTAWDLLIDIKPYTHLFEECTFYNLDYRELPLSKGVIYADPPYLGGFNTYSNSVWTLETTLDLLAYLKSTGLPIVLSLSYSQDQWDMLKMLDFHATIVEAPRRIAANGDRDKAKEILGTYKL